MSALTSTTSFYNTKYIVMGFVLKSNRITTVAGITVKAFDKDLQQETVVGTTVTGATGHYIINFTSQDLGRPDKAFPDLIVRGYDPEGNLVAASRLIEMIDSTEQVLNLIIGTIESPEPPETEPPADEGEGGETSPGPELPADNGQHYDNLLSKEPTAISDYIAEPGPVCRDDKRRSDILLHPRLNGIESIEYEYRGQNPNPHVLVVRFLKPLPDPPNSSNADLYDADGAYGLTTSPGLVKIHGGTRVVNIQVLAVLHTNDHLEIEVDRSGDFSVYWLSLGWQREPDGIWHKVIYNLDYQFSRAPFSFKAGCPVDFDCRAAQVCPPQPRIEPVIDYMAKDYASFRQLLIDLIPQFNPDWLERNPADLGITLIELLSHEGDLLSYFQDAVANEAYLDTSRQRVSAKFHSRFIDYRMHDGRNAWTCVHIGVDVEGDIPQHTKILTRIGVPLQNQVKAPGIVIGDAELTGEAYDTDPALAQVIVFETAFRVEVYPQNNEIFLHTWGNQSCCLPRGSKSAFLYAIDPSGLVIRPNLKAGDLLLIEEVKGPVTGKEADADPSHRQVVRLVSAEADEDSTYKDVLQDGSLQICQAENDNPLPLLRVFWAVEDALRFPACISVGLPGDEPRLNLTIARGNLVLADHGRTVREEITASRTDLSNGATCRLPLKYGPLTMQAQPDKAGYHLEGSTNAVILHTPRPNLTAGVHQVKPAVALCVSSPVGKDIWTCVPDLLDSSPFDRHFVADVDNDGRATLRFGDGVYGQEPAEVTGQGPAENIGFVATYRIGNGRSGNIGAEALYHIVRPDAAINWPSVIVVRNPLPAQDGTDQETIEEVRQYAPAAFHAEQFRAVTEADYIAAAMKMPEVAGAAAMFRWTGSWYTVYLGIDPRNPEDLITEPGGRTCLDPYFEQRVLDFITRYRLADYDLEIRSGHYVPLEIDLEVCVKADYFRGDVGEAARQALSNRLNPDGAPGFFHPDHFTFGDPVYLSQIYAAVKAVEGVDSVVVTRFQRYGEMDNGELGAGCMPIGPWEIARLDNDPNFMENGVLRILLGGGK